MIFFLLIFLRIKRTESINPFQINFYTSSKLCISLWPSQNTWVQSTELIMLQNFVLMGRWKQFHLFLTISWWAVWTLSDEFILTESDRRYGSRTDLAVAKELVALGMSSCFALGVITLQEYTTFYNSVLSYLKLHSVVWWSWCNYWITALYCIWMWGVWCVCVCLDLYQLGH